MTTEPAVPEAVLRAMLERERVMLAALQRVLDWMDHGRREDREAVAEQVQAAMNVAKGGA